MTNEASQLMNVRIRRFEVIAKDIACLEIVPAGDFELPPFSAGSHVDVFINDGVIRQYSICNDPADPSHYRLAVQKEATSRGGSKAIHETFRTDDVIRISRPRNNFGLAEDAEDIVLVAGGIGVTPILSMAYQLSRRQADFTFHLCARSRDRAAFVEEIAASPFASRFHLHLDEGPSQQRFDPFRAFGEIGPRATVYICGPKGFMDFVAGAAKNSGCQAGRIHVESFTPLKIEGEAEFEVVAARSGMTITVPSDKSIADALIDAGIMPKLSCEQGICGSCLTRVISGDVDHRDTYQTDNEKRENKQMSICCSRARSKQIVLDI
ncbi:vanillate O-demethylase ferredoxin subunit [Aminobacter lissarensis]|uniref:Vanillate O-demethylase ferredoxin subunit n=1 Tax=Aminobacter carboxidus TaxID=376165 RepID=A0A8E1WIX2_9HYPH|nr:PDR/VanB family oxidoreductase [Aminobacter lissarensis]MBB6469322.1 vanillate O-demethylase ferredoxin subunit [Aminobacter lissarensis]